jgi:hypothetical protein
MEDDGFGDEGETDTEGGEPEADDEAWGELEGQQGDAATVGKSLAKKRVVRIVV